MATRGTSGRGDALEHVLLRNRSQHHGEPGAKKGDPQPRVGRRKEFQLARRSGMLDHRRHTAGQPAYHIGDVEQPAHRHRHLHEIEDRHRKHATEGGVGQHDDRTENHADVLADRAVGHHEENEPHGLDLRGDPAQVGHDDAQRGDHFDRAVVAQTVVIADGQQIQLVEFGRIEDAGDDQAHRCAERIGHHAAQPFGDELRGHAENRLGTEPGGEHGGGDHRQGQAAAGDREVLRVMDPPRGIQTDADRHHQIDHHEPDQHARPGISIADRHAAAQPPHPHIRHRSAPGKGCMNAQRVPRRPTRDRTPPMAAQTPS
jgi:hypothetical protein